MGHVDCQQVVLVQSVRYRPGPSSRIGRRPPEPSRRDRNSPGGRARFVEAGAGARMGAGKLQSAQGISFACLPARQRRRPGDDCRPRRSRLRERSTGMGLRGPRAGASISRRRPETPGEWPSAMGSPRQLIGHAVKQAREWFAAACHRAAVANYTWHANRHTFISRLIMAGVPLRTVQEPAGHKTIAMTCRYAHLAPEHQLDAVRVLDGWGHEAGKQSATRTATGRWLPSGSRIANRANLFVNQAVS